MVEKTYDIKSQQNIEITYSTVFCVIPKPTKPKVKIKKNPQQ